MRHAMNVGNFESLIALCATYETRYNPVTTNLSIKNLLEIEIKANKMLAVVNVARTKFNHHCDVRRIHFTAYKKLAKQAINELLISGASDLTIRAVKEIEKKFNGIKERSVKMIEIPPGNIEITTSLSKKIMVGKLSFISQIDNFKNLLEFLKQQNNYKPNDFILQTQQLGTTLSKLKKIHYKVIRCESTLDSVKIIRNDHFYAPETGMVTIAINVKKYIKETFGSSSSQYRQINQLKFVNIRIHENEIIINNIL